jgi:hypothetical protein
MHVFADAKLLLLVIVANGAPVIGKDLLGRDYSFPLDGTHNFIDGRRLLGSAKTIRGILLSLAITAAAAPALGMPWDVGLLIGAMAMLGDLISSFSKRRLGLAASSMAIGLDQIPESLLPLLACMPLLALTTKDVVAVVFMFVIAELLLSRFLYSVRLRDRPY